MDFKNIYIVSSVESWVIVSLSFFALGFFLLLFFSHSLKVNKTFISIAFALISCIFAEVTNIAPHEKLVFESESSLGIPYFALSIDWNIIATIVGLSFFYESIASIGFFSWLSVYFIRYVCSSISKLYAISSILSVLITIATNNVFATFVVVPLIVVSLKHLHGVKYIYPILFVQILLANFAGLFFLTSSYSNIILGLVFDVNSTLLLLTQKFFLLNILLIFITFYFGKFYFKLSNIDTSVDSLIAFDCDYFPISKIKKILVLVLLFLFFISVQCYKSFEPISGMGLGLIVLSLGFLALMLLGTKRLAIFQEMDWGFIFYVIGLFVFANVLKDAGVLKLFYNLMFGLIDQSSKWFAAITFIICSIYSALFDNISISVFISEIFSTYSKLSFNQIQPILFATAVGGSLLPFSSLPGILVASVITRNYPRRKKVISIFLRDSFIFFVLNISILVGFLLLFSF